MLNSSHIDISLLKDIRVLYVEDDSFLREQVEQFLKMRFPQVVSASNGKEGLDLYRQHRPDVIITDIRMPIMTGLEMARRIRELDSEIPILVLTAFTEVSFLMKAIEIGIDKFLQKPIEGDKILEAIFKCQLPRIQKREIDNLNQRLQVSMEAMLGRSPAIQKVIRQVQQVAASNFSVVLYGETGVGKTLVANTIHNLSPRADRPFVQVDIGAIPETLVESELFGHRKGAFTGADRNKAGYFETANRGTIFLDDLENLSPYVQTKLLRTVEDRKVIPLGSTTAIDLDVRIICASNRDLTREVKNKNFREDLYYRICEFAIFIPPLRERMEDIPPLACRFAQEAASELHKGIKGIEDEALTMLTALSWEGNVRELKNVIRKAVLICDRSRITIEDLQGVITPGGQPRALALEPAGDGCLPPAFPMEAVEKWAIEQTLKLARYKVTKAAAMLDIDYKTLMAKVRKFGIEIP